MSSLVKATNDSGLTITFSTQIGRYSYVRTIGRGSYSVVSLVQDNMGRFYAAKIVSRQQLINEDLFGQFEQEVRLVQSFNHPNIIKIVDVIFNTDNISIIMEYCSNGDLFNFISKNGPLEEDQIKLIFRGLISAVSYIHEHHVSHRDIKPENILLNGDFVPKLIDFGFCHILNEEDPNRRLLSTPCGSPFYAPPEIIKALPYDGRLSDMWSCGVVLYIMATGALPWNNTSQVALFQEIQDAVIYIPPDLPPPIQHLLLRLLDKFPERRLFPEDILNMKWIKTDSNTAFIKGKPLAKSKWQVRSYQSHNDALSAMKAQQKFSDPPRRLVIIKPTIGSPSSLMTHTPFALKTFTRPSAIRKVPPSHRVHHP